MSQRLLLDTHTLLWAAHQPGLLSKLAFEAISDGKNQVFVSAVSGIEIAIKAKKGRLEFDTPLTSDFARQVAHRGMEELPVLFGHAQLAGSFDSPHKDPWDRLLAAQAKIEDLSLVSNDPQMITFGIRPLW